MPHTVLEILFFPFPSNSLHRFLCIWCPPHLNIMPQQSTTCLVFFFNTSMLQILMQNLINFTANCLPRFDPSIFLSFWSYFLASFSSSSLFFLVFFLFLFFLFSSLFVSSSSSWLYFFIFSWNHSSSRSPNGHLKRLYKMYCTQWASTAETHCKQHAPGTWFS